MFIDFHTHIFPDKIAEKAISKLADVIRLEPSTQGTFDSLMESMEDSGVDISVVLPPVTAPSQYESILRFASQINDRFYEHPDHGILSMAGIHPDCGDLTEKLKQIKSLGFPGIKVHPDYQHTLFNDIRYKRILDKASELDLFVLTHAGYDVYSPDLVHCTVPMILEVMEEVHPTKLVLAHMGNNMFYDEVEADLLGCDAYLDTAFSISTVDPKRLASMIHKHGADKVLFGTDCPWSNPKEDVKTLSQMDLTETELELVSHRNAQKLLHLGDHC